MIQLKGLGEEKGSSANYLLADKRERWVSESSAIGGALELVSKRDLKETDYLEAKKNGI